jgi:hypothetical protein
MRTRFSMRRRRNILAMVDPASDADHCPFGTTR